MRAIRVILVLVGLLGIAAPAVAADQIGLSWDGRTWATQLTGTLFNRAGSIARWVPGDSDTEHFYVRNQGGDAAGLRIEYELPPSTLVNDDDFEVTASVDGAAPVPLTAGADWLPLTSSALANGAIADVAVTATFRWSSTDQSMRDQFPLAFRVTLTEAVAGSPQPEVSASPNATASPHPGPSQGPGNGGPGTDAGGPLGGLLPNTGAPAVGWYVSIGLICLGGGLLIVGLSRRRGRDADAS